MNQPAQADMEEAKELAMSLDVLTAGEGDYGDGGQYANRYPPDIRRSDVTGWLVEAAAKMLATARAKAFRMCLDTVREAGATKDPWGNAIDDLLALARQEGIDVEGEK